MLYSIEQRIATELTARLDQVTAAVVLLDEGATVPFIARYRKEVTGGLDDVQLRHLQERLDYLRELEARRCVIINTIKEQGKMTPKLQNEVNAAETKQRLEDLYLPYKPKRRTKAQIAREAGLETLANTLFNNPMCNPHDEAKQYVCEQVLDTKAALVGAQHILIERFAEDAGLLHTLRTFLTQKGQIISKVLDHQKTKGEKFRDWFDYHEALCDIPSHRALALFRGRHEDILRLSIKTSVELAEPISPSPCEAIITQYFGLVDQGRPADAWLMDTARRAWLLKLSVHLEVALMADLRTRAEEEAIRVFARNLHDLLLAAPAGPRTIMGLDPGLRTGVKIAVVNYTGKLMDTATIYPHPPRCDWEGALATLSRLCQKHRIELLALGNGTASRETDRLLAELIKYCPELKLIKMTVSEAGASVYSASALASQEFPDLDVSLRGAVSIARRLQDPLAELVKIDPKSIGVGQYQHDVNQSRLSKSLDQVIEDCVNGVGVDLNTASASLLAHVSGLNTAMADNIVMFRNAHGAFGSREQLKKVAKIGDKAYEQAAGFLRINDGKNPLDRSAVHPESYPVVERILADLQKSACDVLGNEALLHHLKPEKYTNQHFGLPTVRDILRELAKPGRDPRPTFQTANFRDGVERLQDLIPGMLLEGVITNVANFGAFVDIGVHQDGLIHISALSHQFVRDPRSVVKAGEVVKVKVLDVDIVRKRVSLTMRLSDDPTPPTRPHSHTSPMKQPTQRASSVAKGQSAPQTINAKQPYTDQSSKPIGVLGASLAKALNK